MSQVDAIEAAITPTLVGLGYELIEVDLVGSGKARTLRVAIDRDGGIDLAAITEATKAVNPVLDAADIVPGTYTLEVSSPGIERPLRRPAQFARAVGETVTVKTRDADGKAVRIRGTLVTADDAGIEVAPDGAIDDTAADTTSRRVAYDDIIAARTVFEWGTSK